MIWKNTLAATAGLCVVMSGLGLEAVSAQAPAEIMPATADEFIEQMDALFEARPELKNQRGSGWKPFNRFKWDHQRVAHTPIPEAARLKAWEKKKEIEAQRGGGAPMWFSLGPTNFGGRMLAVDFDPVDPSVVYAGSAGGGVFKSTNSGGAWTAISDDIPSLAVGGVAVSRTNSNIIVIGTGEPTFNIDRSPGVGIWRSTDAGATWGPTDLVYTRSQGHGFHVMTASPSGAFLGGAVDGIYRSTDDGATWTQVIGTVSATFVNGWYDIQYDPQDASRVYAVKGNDSATNGVYVSEDDGVTWALSGTGQPASIAFGKSKLGVSGDTIYCYVGERGFGGGVYGLLKSIDDGATWTEPAAVNLPSGQSWYNLVCVADPNDSERVLCGAVRLHRSTNGGASFVESDSNVHVDHHALLYETGSDSRLFNMNDGGAYISLNDGGAWFSRNIGLVSYQFYDICVNNGADPYYIMGGTQDNGTDKWSGTTSWTNGLGADGMVCNIDPTNSTTVYAEIQFGDHRKSTTSGSGFTEINNGIFGSGSWVTPVDEDQTNGDRLFTETSAGIFRTTNGGANWTNVTSSRANWISISTVDPMLVWGIAGTSVHKSTDGGDTWETSSVGLPAGAASRIFAHPIDVDTAVATFTSFNPLTKVAVTTDGGASWQDASGNLPDMPIYSVAINPSNAIEWYIGTDLGVWRSINSGASWAPYGDGFPNVVVDDIEIQNSLQKLVAGTHGRGAWEIEVGTAVAVESGQAPTPRNLMLDSPWPNPASDRTLIRYAARVDVPVTLRIFDVQGRLVRELETFDTGDGVIRTTPWFTDGVANGVYMAVLDAGTERVTRKIMVQR